MFRNLNHPKTENGHKKSCGRDRKVQKDNNIPSHAAKSTKNQNSSSQTKGKTYTRRFVGVNHGTHMPFNCSTMDKYEIATSIKSRLPQITPGSRRPCFLGHIT